MKKLILIVATLFILFISCDPYYYNKLYIINNCEELITISITDTWNKIETFSVEAHTTYLFDEGQGIATPKGMIKGLKFEVTKNGVRSNVNYSDFSKWIYIETKDKYHSELYLPINTEDFE